MNKYVVGAVFIVVVYTLGFALGYYSGNAAEQKHLNTIRNLEKTDYRTVLYGFPEEDYVLNQKYDNGTDYAAAISLQNKVYRDIQSRYENHLVNNLLKVDLRVQGAEIKDYYVIREKVPVQLESPRDGLFDGSGDYSYSYDIATHTLSINIDYFKLQSKINREPVFRS